MFQEKTAKWKNKNDKVAIVSIDTQNCCCATNKNGTIKGYGTVIMKWQGSPVDVNTIANNGCESNNKTIIALNANNGNSLKIVFSHPVIGEQLISNKSPMPDDSFVLAYFEGFNFSMLIIASSEAVNSNGIFYIVSVDEEQCKLRQIFASYIAQIDKDILKPYYENGVWQNRCYEPQFEEKQGDDDNE